MEQLNLDLAALNKLDHAVWKMFCKKATTDNTYAPRVFLCVLRGPARSVEKDDEDSGKQRVGIAILW